jgi:dihydroflavonol-4-reductase
VKHCSVTGGNGFIGSNVVRQLLESGFEVTALVGSDMGLENLEGLPVKTREIDVLDRASVRSALAGDRRLIHTAASYSFWMPDPAHAYRVNVAGTRNVLETALELGYEKVVYTSSTATLSPPFGVASGEVADERGVFDLSRFRGHYKMSKAMAENVALRMTARGLPLSILHPTTVLGPGDRRPTPTGSMIVHYINGRMKAYAEMEQNVVDVRDVARGHVLALERGRSGERYVLGGDNLSMREIVDELEALTGIPAPRFAIPNPMLRALGLLNDWISTHVTGRPPLFPYEAALHARDSRRVSCAKAAEELGYRWRPAREVLAAAVRWFVAEGYAAPRWVRTIEDRGALDALLGSVSDGEPPPHRTT